MSPLCKNCGRCKTCRANILICSSSENLFEDNFRDVLPVAGQRQLLLHANSTDHQITNR